MGASPPRVLTGLTGRGRRPRRPPGRRSSSSGRRWACTGTSPCLATGWAQYKAWGATQKVFLKTANGTWYYRVRANPEVELTQGGETKPYRAVALDTPEAQQHMIEIIKKGGAARYWLSRAMLLFAPIKPVRLDPR